MPPNPPPLGPGEAHVWVLTLDRFRSTLPHLSDCLPEDERVRAGRFRFEDDRCRFLIGRACARQLLAAYLAEADPARLPLREGAHGKPFLERDPDPSIRFNWSHSGEIVAVAFSRDADIGVDIERVDRATDIDAVAERVFSATELAAYRTFEGEARREAFFNGWTRKEAFIKATGEGLSRALQGFDVEIRPGRPPRILAIDGEPAAAARWTVQAFSPRPGYVGAVAVHAPGVRVAWPRWPE